MIGGTETGKNPLSLIKWAHLRQIIHGVSNSCATEWIWILLLERGRDRVNYAFLHGQFNSQEEVLPGIMQSLWFISLHFFRIQSRFSKTFFISGNNTALVQNLKSWTQLSLTSDLISLPHPAPLKWGKRMYPQGGAEPSAKIVQILMDDCRLWIFAGFYIIELRKVFICHISTHRE